MDTIWNSAFGVDIDIQNNPENEYFDKCEKVFGNTSNLRTHHYIGSIYIKLSKRSEFSKAI